MKTIKLSLCTIFVALAVCSVSAQNTIMEIVSRIEANNTTLSAKRESTKAAKLEARTGLNPSNPEFEFGYIWGSPGTPGNRIDVSFKQEFDFPSAYVYKGRISKLAIIQADLTYGQLRYEVVGLAYDLCLEMIYLNAMSVELDVRLERARRLNDYYQKMLITGQDNAINASKTRLALLTIEKKRDEILTTRKGLIEQLSALNGGEYVVFDQAVFAPVVLDESFDYWFLRMSAKNPALAYLTSQVERMGQQVKLNSAEGLPRIGVGYKSEAVMRSDQFQGVVASISIPLWENKNRVKAAKAATIAAQSEEDDGKLQFYKSLHATYQRVESLAQTIAKYKQRGEVSENIEMLGSALSNGAISVLDYFKELESSYDMIDSDLLLERDLHLAYRSLTHFDL